MAKRDDGRDGVRVYCTRGHACWVVVLLLIVAGVIVVRSLSLETPDNLMVPGVIVVLLLAIATLIIIAEVNTGIRVGEEGLTVQEWPHADRFLPWESIAAMRWRHGWWRWLAEHLRLRVQPGAHGVVELQVTDRGGERHWMTILNYVCCGGPPGAVQNLLDEIARHSGLSQVAERPPTLHPKFEETEWARGVT